MNPSLRFLMFFLVPAACAVPLQAQGLPLEFQFHTPYFRAIIDDPDPTGRMRLLPRFTEYERLILLPAGMTEPDPVVAWARRSRSGFDVVVGRYRQDTFGPGSIVASSPADELDPRLVQDPRDGTVHLVYWIDGPNPVVVHRVAPADLSWWSEPEPVSAPGERAARPSVCFHDGRLHVAYESLGPAAGDAARLIVLARKVAAGFTTEVVGATSHPLPASPHVQSDRGRMWVEWVDGAGIMAWREVSPEGRLEPIDHEPFDSPLDRELARGRIALRAGR